MRLLQGLVACLVIGAAWPVTAESPTQFRFWKTLDRGVARDEEIIAFVLDSDIFSATRGGFPDIRIVDEVQAEAPYQLESDVEYREELSRQAFGTEIVSLREEGTAIEVQLRIPVDSPLADGFTLATPQADYERKIQVSGSLDGSEWTPLVTDHIIFDYTRYMDVSNREIALPANNCRQFKLLIADVTDDKESPYKEMTRTFRGGKEEQLVEQTKVERRTFRIDGIEAWHNVTQQRVRKTKTTVYPILGFESQEDASKKLTTLTVHTRREPISSLTLETSSRNFYRRAVVEVPEVQGVRTEWREIGSATVSNFGFRNYRREQLKIEFPEHREPTFRIVLHNEDNPPLDIQGVKAEGNVYRVVFLAQPAKSYRCYYGSEVAEVPKYEAATVLSALRQEDFRPVAAQLGEESANQDFGEEPSLAVRKLLNNWIFLGTVICLVVVVLGWSLYRAGHHLDELPQDNTGVGQDSPPKSH
ncbi:MAG: DUF3999 family protein [Pirellulaceae bacterium]